eukprot:1829141-Alexandrium_andersonii.AAC.1
MPRSDSPALASGGLCVRGPRGSVFRPGDPGAVLGTQGPRFSGCSGVWYSDIPRKARVDWSVLAGAEAYGDVGGGCAVGSLERCGACALAARLRIVRRSRG